MKQLPKLVGFFQEKLPALQKGKNVFANQLQVYSRYILGPTMSMINSDSRVSISVFQVVGYLKLDIWRCHQYVGFTVDSMRIQKDWPFHPNVCVTELAGSC